MHDKRTTIFQTAQKGLGAAGALERLLEGSSMVSSRSSSSSPYSISLIKVSGPNKHRSILNEQIKAQLISSASLRYQKHGKRNVKTSGTFPIYA